MKKLFIIPMALLILTACGGWSSKDKDDFKKICETTGRADCDCALKKAMEKYPSTPKEGDKDAMAYMLDLVMGKDCPKK